MTTTNHHHPINPAARLNHMKATAAPKKKKKTAATKALRNKDGQKRTVVHHKNGTMQVVHWLDNAVSDIVGPALYHKIQTTVLKNERTTNGTVTKTKRLLGYVKVVSMHVGGTRGVPSSTTL